MSKTVPRPKVRGKGGYDWIAPMAGSALGGLAGAIAGGPTGASYGTTVGNWVGGLFNKVLGFGAYSVKSNTLLSQQIPSFGVVGESGVEICHREFLCDVLGSIAFENRAYAINPGIYSNFPWLSSIAQSFTEYEFLGLIFEFIPSSGMVSQSTPALGTVIMASNYNVVDAPYSDKVAMESSQYAVSGLPCGSLIHPVECAPTQKALNHYYIRSSVVQDNLHLYDWCNFQFATQGMSSAYVIGELWVSYHVRLIRPRRLSAPVHMAHWACISETAGTTSDITDYLYPCGDPILILKSSYHSTAAAFRTCIEFPPGVAKWLILLMAHINAGPSLTLAHSPYVEGFGSDFEKLRINDYPAGTMAYLYRATGTWITQSSDVGTDNDYGTVSVLTLTQLGTHTSQSATDCMARELALFPGQLSNDAIPAASYDLYVMQLDVPATSIPNLGGPEFRLGRIVQHLVAQELNRQQPAFEMIPAAPTKTPQFPIIPERSISKDRR
jgi:hypothetical protein